jgi:hypothetical protein
MKISRREFIRVSGAGALFAGLGQNRLLGGLAGALPVRPSSPFYEQLASDEFPFPFDQAFFEAAERIANVRRNPADPSQWLTDLNLLIKQGKALDVKVLTADRREDLANPREVISFSGAQSSIDTVLRGYDSPRLHYQVQYREGLGAWKALPPRSFKLPNVNLGAGGQIQAILLGDDHTFDDADYALPAAYTQTRISGNYMVDFLASLKANPAWTPEPPLSSLQFSFLLIRAVAHILAREDPDFFIHLGDCNGIGAPYKWQNWGLPYKNLTDADYDFISRTLWLRTRKAFSGLTPNMPVLFALGNHDGESSWEVTRIRAREWRQKLFPQPTDATYNEGGHPQGNFYGFSWGSDKDNRGGAQFLVLDNSGFTGPLPKKPEEWTLGAEQLAWFQGALERTDPEWRFACFHHVLGGWPSGSNEGESAYAYGRGPLFTAEDYKGLADTSKVEQIKLTELAKTNGLRAFLYGHDHIFKAKRIGPGANQKDLYGIVAGSTKHVGEFAWWQAPYWRKFYGEGFKAAPDFFGPSGITRLTIRKDQAKFEYVCTGITPNTNLAGGGIVAAVQAGAILANPAPSIKVEAPEGPLEFVRDELDPTASSPRTLRVRNGGGQRLDFRIMGGPIWIKVASREGSSCLAAADIAVSPSSDLPEPGTHTDEISVEGPGAKSVQVPVRLTINAAPLFPPNNFRAAATPGVGIILRWKASSGSRGVTKYRIYLLDAKNVRSRIAELDASKASYVLRKVNFSAEYRFAIVAVNSAGRESDAAFASA